MVTYRAQAKKEETKNLMAALANNTAEGEKSGKNGTADDKLYPHWKQELYLNVICDHTKYPKNSMHTGVMPPAVAANLKVDSEAIAYEPILYLSDFWHLKRDHVLLNDSLEG